jgi:hypothetical protein
MPEPRISGWRPWALLPVALLWLVGTILKETPRFWRAEGGYPVQLRMLVLDFHYPFTAGLLVLCFWGLLHDLRQGRRPLRPTTVGWVLLALVLGAGLALLVGNNLVNLIEGRALHAHPR